ncbi:MAG: hypothetical protein ACI9K2_001094 [Myxococcota bacterium]
MQLAATDGSPWHASVMVVCTGAMTRLGEPVPFDRSVAEDSLLEAPTRLAMPRGLPAHELSRSPCAARVGALAAESGLFGFHYEHRVRLPWPEAWGEREAVGWNDGRLPEPKYAAFRHDLPIASFHPGHRAKWSAHELCHALVGFAWRPDAPPLWHATAARLAELLPVVLWYCLDEVRLTRCRRHDAPLFRGFCEDCEQAAAPRPWATQDRTALADARRFLDRELAAIVRTRRLGVPVPHIHGSLDLCSDGIAYAAAHGDRLRSDTFHQYAERFLVAGAGWHDQLDALEARVVEVACALTEGGPLAPIGTRERWETQDLGWRLLTRYGTCEAVDRLAGDGDLREARAWVRRTSTRADAGEVLAVGYGDGRSTAQAADGVASVAPLTLELLDSAGGLDDFVRQDTESRANIGDRLAAWLDRQGVDAPVLGALARYETALRTASHDAEARVLGAGRGHRVAAGVKLLVEPVDPIRLAERVEAGDIDAAPGFTLMIHEGGPVVLEPAGALVVRDASGDLVLAEADADVVDALREGAMHALDPDTLADLAELGVLVAEAWPLE